MLLIRAREMLGPPARPAGPPAHEGQLVARVGGFGRAAALEALALALVLLLRAPASAETFTNVYFFGASGEDTGIFTPTHADSLQGLDLVSTYGYDADRWTNAGGRVWAERFAEALGHSATSRTHGGTNYAIGGGGPGGTEAQIDLFSVDHGAADPDALYYIFVGGDALLQAASPSDAVSAMVARIVQLRALGATHFLIPNFPDYGPFAPGAGPLGPISPIPPNASEWATAYATELSAALSTLSGVTIYQLDLKGLLDPLFADPVGHGFSAGLTLCVEVPDCRTGIGVDEYVMFDHLHPTSATHDLWAQAALALIPAACSSGVDEDGDGRIDFGSDPGCADPADPSERGEDVCDNGVDDNANGLTDFPEDPGCQSPQDDSEGTPLGSSCASSQVKAFSGLCSAQLRCHAQGVKSPSAGRLDACLSEAQSRFSSTLTRRSTASVRAGEVCATDQASASADDLEAWTLGLVTEVLEGADLLNRSDAALRAAITRHAGALCESDLRTLAREFERTSADQGDAARLAARERFLRSTGKAIQKADEAGVSYDGLTPNEIAEALQALAEELADQLSP